MLTVHRRSLALLAVMAVCGSPSLFAQTTAQFPMQFDFTSPGARSLAMGGAFVGSADDASAAFINPAGLVFYGKLEASGELRFATRETSFLAGGRVSGQVTGRGLDTIAGPVYDHDDDTQAGLAFLSMMVPIGSRLTLTGYRNEVARVDNSFFSQGAFLRATFAGITDDLNRELPVDGRRQVSITNYGGAVGVRFNDALAVGGGVSFYKFDLDARFARHGVLTDTFSPPDLSIVSSTATQSGEDVTPSVNGGLLWKPHASVNVGASFRHGPSFDFEQHDRVPDAEIDLTRQGHFDVPDVISAGVKWQPLASGRLTVLTDYSRVYYSQLLEDFVTFQALASKRPDQLRIDDGNEFRSGGGVSAWQHAHRDPACRLLARPGSHGSIRLDAGARHDRHVLRSDAARRRRRDALHLRRWHRVVGALRGPRRIRSLVAEQAADHVVCRAVQAHRGIANAIARCQGCQVPSARVGARCARAWSWHLAPGTWAPGTWHYHFPWHAARPSCIALSSRLPGLMVPDFCDRSHAWMAWLH